MARAFEVRAGSVSLLLVLLRLPCIPGADVQSACLRQFADRSTETLQDCLNEVAILVRTGLQTKDEEQQENYTRQFKKATVAMASLRTACPGAIDRATGFGCEIIMGLVDKLFGTGLFALRTCLEDEPSPACTKAEKIARELVRNAWGTAETRCRNTGSESMVTSKLEALREGDCSNLLAVPAELVGALRQANGLAGYVSLWQDVVTAIAKLMLWVDAYLWKESQMFWLEDSIKAGKVVHTIWGTAEEWQSRYGVHDAHADAPLATKNGEGGPTYLMSDKFGMRWQIVPRLLTELYERRGSPAEGLVIAEIGVFAGQLSHHILQKCEFVQLFGIDPYIGVDGTFPGNYSETLDAKVAMHKAAVALREFGDRVKILHMTSKEAVEAFDNDSIDAVFVDGCHLYDCVVSDFDLWLPKLRRGVETLVAGHDFSPQWPGVVRAVHERRAHGLPVTLATDWLFWWTEQRE